LRPARIGQGHQDPPAILTVEQVKQCLDWLVGKRSRAFAWFVLTSFAGLRPEEAEKTSWHHINFDEGWVRVEAQTTKVRQRRRPPADPVFASADPDCELRRRQEVVEIDDDGTSDIRRTRRADQWPSDGVFSEVLLGDLGAIGRGETEEDKTLITSRL